MAIETVLLIVALIALAGGVASYFYGEQRYGKGIIDGIQMLDAGRLTYKSYYEGDDKYLNIQIEPEDEK